MSRATSKPTDKDHSKAIRMAQYSGDPSNQRAIQEFRFDTLEPTVVDHTNSDWAGCRSSGKSTWFKHWVIERWNSTQRLVALGSAEAIEIRSLAADRNRTRHRDQNRHRCGLRGGEPTRCREGCGCRARVEIKSLTKQKVHDERNMAHMIKKNGHAEALNKHLAAMGSTERKGRDKRFTTRQVVC